MSNEAAQESAPVMIYLHSSLKNRKYYEASTTKICQKSVISVAMKKWFSCVLCSNHSGQDMKHHKNLLYDDFMHLSIENMKY